MKRVEDEKAPRRDDLSLVAFALMKGWLTQETLHKASIIEPTSSDDFAERLIQSGLVSPSQYDEFQAADESQWKSALDLITLETKSKLMSLIGVRSELEPEPAIVANDPRDTSVAAMTVPRGRDKPPMEAPASQPDAFETQIEVEHVDPHATLSPEQIAAVPPLSSTSVGSDPSQSRGRFGILKFHAKGGLGQVSIAVDSELGRHVALKEVQPHCAEDFEARARFVREAEITGRLEHPGVVPVYGFGFAADGRPYYAMRFIHGRSLKDRIEEFYQLEETESRRRLSFRELMRRLIDVCNTMEYAHSHGVLHRDLKPANIMVGEYGETLVVDWGLAKALGENEPVEVAKTKDRVNKKADDTETLDGTAMGTPQYMSPEQAAGKHSSLTATSDVYSLGATLFHLLTGKTAFQGKNVKEVLTRVIEGQFDSPRDINPRVPPPLNSICLKAMAREPSDRYASAKELASDIERWLADEPVRAHGEGWLERWYRRLRRHRSWVMGVATMVPLLLVVMSLAAFFVNRERLEAIKQRDTAVDAKEEEKKQRLLAEQSEKHAKEQERLADKATQEAGQSLAEFLLSTADTAQADKDWSAAALRGLVALPVVERFRPSQARTHRIRLARLIRSLPRPIDLTLLPPETRSQAVTYLLSPNDRWWVSTGVMPGAAAYDFQRQVQSFASLGSLERLPWLTFTHHDDRLVTASSERSKIEFWDLLSGDQVLPAITTRGRIAEPNGSTEAPFAISPNDDRVAVLTSKGEGESQVEIYSIRNPDIPTIIPFTSIHSFGFLPQNDRFWLASDGDVDFFEPDSGERIGESIVFDGMTSATVSPSGDRMITTSNNAYAQLWDVESRTPIGPKLTHREIVTDAEFSPSGRFVVTLSADKSARVWNVATGESVGPMLEHLDRPIHACFREDEELVATVSIDHKVYVWEIKTGLLTAGPWSHPTAPVVQFIEDDLRIAVQGRCMRWDLSRSEQDSAIEFVPPDVEKSVFLADFIDSDRRLVIGDDQGFWVAPIDPTHAAGELRTVRTPKSIKDYRVSHNKEVLAALSNSNDIYVYDLKQPQMSPLNIQSPFNVSQWSLDAEGKNLLLADERGSCLLRRIGATDESVAIDHPDIVLASEFNADGSHLATGCRDKYVRLWDTRTGALVGEPRLVDSSLAFAMPVTSVAFHPDGKTLAAGSASEIRIYCPFDKDFAERTFQFDGPLHHLRFSTRGSLLGATGYLNPVQLWDWQSSKLMASLPDNLVSKIRFGPCEEIVATANIGHVAINDTRDGRLIGPLLPVHTTTIDLDAKSEWLITGGPTVKVWDIRSKSTPHEAMTELVNLLSGRRIDERGTLSYLTSEEQLKLFEDLKQTALDELTPLDVVRILLPRHGSIPNAPK